MGIEYKYLRKQKAKRIRETYESSFAEKRELSAPVYSNSTILPVKKYHDKDLLFGYAGVLDENGKYIKESSIKKIIDFGYETKCDEIIDKKVVYCGYLVNHWGHFLVEAVARLWYYLENDDTIDSYVFVLDLDEEREIKNNYKEFFELLGIGDKLEIINKPQKYREVVVPQLGYSRAEYYSQQHKSVFEVVADNITIDASWETYDKIFFTRSGFSKAKQFEIGMDMLDSYFGNNGFKIVSPEKISLSQMIYLIRNAEVCANASGTLQHNMLFAKDDQTLLLIEKQPYTNDYSIDINRAKNLNVIYIDANLSIYPVDFGAGPFVLMYNKYLEQFTIDNSYCQPHSNYLHQRYKNKIFKQYMKTYVDYYGYQWIMKEEYYECVDYLYEAYLEALDTYNDYIRIKKPFKFVQIFDIRYIKGIIKRIIQ